MSESGEDPTRDAVEALVEAVRERCGNEIEAVSAALSKEARFCQRMVAEVDGARVHLEVWRTGR